MEKREDFRYDIVCFTLWTDLALMRKWLSPQVSFGKHLVWFCFTPLSGKGICLMLRWGCLVEVHCNALVKVHWWSLEHFTEVAKIPHSHIYVTQIFTSIAISGWRGSWIVYSPVPGASQVVVDVSDGGELVTAGHKQRVHLDSDFKCIRPLLKTLPCPNTNPHSHPSLWQSCHCTWWGCWCGFKAWKGAPVQIMSKIVPLREENSLMVLVVVSVTWWWTRSSDRHSLLPPAEG